jgi:hypothetical protein
MEGMNLFMGIAAMSEQIFDTFLIAHRLALLGRLGALSWGKWHAFCPCS